MSEKNTKLDEALRAGVLLCDGAMGTELFRRGYTGDLPPVIWNLERPEVIQAVHEDYVAAGAQLILTNTFSANGPRLAPFDLASQLREINLRGVEIARRAAGDKALVLGDISSTGEESEMTPYGTREAGYYSDAFREQARALAEAGVDALFVETMSSLDEAVLAMEAVRDVVGDATPILCSMCFRKPSKTNPDNFRTFWGNDVPSMVARLREAGADILGANCGEVVEEMPRLARSMREAAGEGMPLVFEINAGPSEFDIDTYETLHRMSPEQLAPLSMEVVRAGGSIIGGCCGTTPAHIKAIREALDHER